MAITKSVKWNGQRFTGYVALGTGVADDESFPPATEALVFMIVAVNANWKCIIAYFLVHALGGKEKANLVTTALSKLHAIGVRILSEPCDGPQGNVAMLRELGVKIGALHVDPTFTHPASGQKCVGVLDVVHMIKFLHNCLTSYQRICSPDSKQISWKYIEEQHNLQEGEGL